MKAPRTFHRRKEAPLLNVPKIKQPKSCDGYHKCEGEYRDLTWDSCKQCALEGMNATTVQN